MTWIEVFKSGTHTDSAGNENTWTDDDLDEIVKVYNEQEEQDKHSAPLVLGHPKDNEPAFGWVEKLMRKGDKLLASITQLSEDIRNDVKDGKYKKVSISLYPSKLLRHIGLLGATPPAVKGLADVQFSQCFSEGRESGGYANYEDVLSDAADPKATARQEQAQRSAAYGISALADAVEQQAVQYAVKPPHFADVPDDMFGDPVNYKFPFDTKANFLASFSALREWRTTEMYKGDDLLLIKARFVEAKERLGITEEELEAWRYSFSEESPRKQRANKHKISIVEGKGHDELPTQYSDLAEEEFADPVNYRFPTKKPFLFGSLATWGRSSVRKDYSEDDQQIIASRIIKAAINSGINLTPYTWAFIEVPAEALSRKQLLDIVNKPKADTNKPTIPQRMDYAMNDQLFEKFIADLLAYASETLGEEVSTQISAKITELKEASAAAGDAASTSDLSEAPEVAALRKKVSDLERVNRANEHKSFTEALLTEGKMLPIQRTLVMELLESLSTYDSSSDFTEADGKTAKKTLKDALKGLMSSYPTVVNFSEEGDAGRGQGNRNKKSEFSESNPERLEQHEKVWAKAEELAKLRNIADPYVCYAEALRIVTTTID